MTPSGVMLHVCDCWRESASEVIRIPQNDCECGCGCSCLNASDTSQKRQNASWTLKNTSWYVLESSKHVLAASRRILERLKSVLGAS